MDLGVIEAMMLKMGFSGKWLGWIFMCLKLVVYSISINVDKVGLVNHGKGMSTPYLFIICVEGLTLLIKKKMDLGRIHGVRINKNEPNISHLVFENDCFLYF